MSAPNETTAAGQPVIQFVLKGYPRLSETFIAQEIFGLERMGLRLQIIALRRPTDKTHHPIVNEIKAPVSYLCEYLHDEPWRVAKAFGFCLLHRHFWAAFRKFCADFRRDPSRSRLRRFGQALVLSAQTTPEVAHLHAHFLHTPASVTRYCAWLTGKSWSVSAHAKDIWTTPEWDLAEKLAEAEWATTCTKNGQSELNRLAPPKKPVALIYHGLDLNRFQPMSLPRSQRNGHVADDPPILLSVCRAVKKKGLSDLLQALALLPKELHWRWVHIGGGEELKHLQALAKQLDLADRIEWRGALTQTQVLDAYREADCFVLPCRIADDGDRDGLPNVLMEAQSQALACLSTAVSGVPELIETGQTGRLVDPEPGGEPLHHRLAEALQFLIENPQERRRLAQAGQRRVRENFDYQKGIMQLHELFMRSLNKANGPNHEA